MSGLEIGLIILVLIILIAFAVIAIYLLYKIEKVIIKTATDIEATLLTVKSTSDNVNNFITEAGQQSSDLQTDVADAKDKLLLTYLEINNINRNVNSLIGFSSDVSTGLCSNPQKFPFCKS